MTVNETASYIRYASDEVYRSSYTDRAARSSRHETHRNERDSYVNRRDIDNVQSLSDSAQAVINSMDRLDNRSLYQNYYARSSNSSYVEVNSSSDPSAKKDFTVEVDKLATGQTNEGTRLAEDGVYSVAADRQTFQIEVDGRNHEFTIDINAGETNEQVLRKMANAVNSGNIGVKAWVSNGRNDTSRLVFESEKTGDLAENKFTVSDVNGGDLVAKTGISRVTQQAQDAVYTVNHQTRTSHDNDVDLGDGINVTLKRETRKPIEISVENDNREAVKTAREFVDAYNQLLADSKSKTNGDTWLNQYLNVYSSSYSAAFERAGITRNSDGSLSIDKKKMAQAAENGQLEKVFAQDGFSNYGVASRIQQIAKNVVRNPSGYIDNAPKNSRYGSQNAFTSFNQSNGYGFRANNRPYVLYGAGNYSLLNLYS